MKQGGVYKRSGDDVVRDETVKQTAVRAGTAAHPDYPDQPESAAGAEPAPSVFAEASPGSELSPAMDDIDLDSEID